MNPIEYATEWFARHLSMREFVRGLVFALIAYAVSYGMVIFALPQYAMVAPIAMAVLIGIDHWARDKPVLPVVGSHYPK